MRQHRKHVAGMATAVALVVTGVVPSIAQPAEDRGQGGLDPAAVRQTEGGRSTVVFASGRYLTAPSRRPPARIALEFVRAHREDFALSPQAANAFVVTKQVRTADDGAHHLVLEQRVRGLPVHGAVLTALVDRDGRLVLIGGRSGELDTGGAVELTAGAAIARAARAAGAADARPPAGSETRREGRHTFPNPYARGVRAPTPVSAELVWYLQDDRSLRLAWRTDVEVSDTSWFGSVVDAATGAVLEHESRYAHSGPRATSSRSSTPTSLGPHSRARRSSASTGRG